MTSVSPNIDRTGETMTLEVLESVDAEIVFTAGPVLEGLNIHQSQLEISEDLAFTLTNVRIPDAGDERPRINGRYFVDEWVSEGSFSASAHKYPEPTPEP